VRTSSIFRDTAPGSDCYAADLGTSMLTSTARPFVATCAQCGVGIVNVSAAVDAVPAAVTPPVGTLTPHSSANDKLSAYNASGKLLGSSLQGTGLKDVFTVTNTGTTAATVYWRVTFVSGTTGSTGVYTLGLSQ
jgi:hypothetical protein